MSPREHVGFALDMCEGVAIKGVRKYVLTCTVAECPVSQMPNGEELGQYSELTADEGDDEARIAAVDACAVCPRLSNFNSASSMDRMPIGLQETSLTLSED